VLNHYYSYFYEVGIDWWMILKCNYCVTVWTELIACRASARFFKMTKNKREQCEVKGQELFN